LDQLCQLDATAWPTAPCGSCHRAHYSGMAHVDFQPSRRRGLSECPQRRLSVREGDVRRAGPQRARCAVNGRSPDRSRSARFDPEQAFALRQRRREPPHRAETIRISNHRDRGGDHWPRWQIARGGRHLFIISSLVDVLGPAVIVYTRGRTGSEDASASARDAGIAVGIRLPRGTAAARF
jgi:hypothetical protein